jgi:hypothetical protein
LGFFILQKQIANHGIFLMRSEPSITAYLFLKLVNNHSIPSTDMERKNTIHSHKHSFTLYPSLSPYRQTDRMIDRGTNALAARGLEELFSSCAVVVSIFWFWREIGVGVTSVLRVQYSCGAVLVFWFWWEISFGVTYVLSVHTIQLCGCVSFLVVAGNSSQNENTF